MKVVEATLHTKVVKEIKDSRKRTEELFSTLEASYLYERPIRERHRVIFYLGHLDAFDYIQICREGLGARSKEPALDELFRAGIDPDADSLPSDTPQDWPTPVQVERYIYQARAAVDEVLDTAPEEAVSMALEHRFMHLETLAYMWHNFDYSVKRKPVERLTANDVPHSQENRWIEIPAGATILGKPRDADGGCVRA